MPVSMMPTMTPGSPGWTACDVSAVALIISMSHCRPASGSSPTAAAALEAAAPALSPGEVALLEGELVDVPALAEGLRHTTDPQAVSRALDRRLARHRGDEIRVRRSDRREAHSRVLSHDRPAGRRDSCVGGRLGGAELVEDDVLAAALRRRRRRYDAARQCRDQNGQRCQGEQKDFTHVAPLPLRLNPARPHAFGRRRSSVRRESIPLRETLSRELDRFELLERLPAAFAVANRAARRGAKEVFEFRLGRPAVRAPECVRP